MAVDGGNTNDRITVAVVIMCMVAATGGLIFGYDIGISGISHKTLKPTCSTGNIVKWRSAIIFLCGIIHWSA